MLLRPETGEEPGKSRVSSLREGKGLVRRPLACNVNHFSLITSAAGSLLGEAM